MKTANQIRQDFLDFFASKDHTIVPSAPVVPHGDPTLLFTNAGMNQFKDVFLGQGTRRYTRAADTQKCIRVSGKHNDLEEVGRDGYHHTFFEMLGNWSFGDYYKKEAIEWAWELLTEVWKLPKDRLFATVYRDDDEAFELWKTCTDIGEDRILRFGEKDNFWEMGDTGPCGPCSEIHYDRTPDKSGKSLVNAGVPEVMEIWNLVFIQYNREADGSLKELPAKHVDTGMGFERIVAVLQNKTSNYDTDIFTPIIAKIAEIAGVPYYPDERGIPHQVIADHIRMITFSIADGALPSNVGRGYVIRRILRRAARFGRKLNLHEPFLYQIVDTLVENYGHMFPELIEQQDHVKRVIEAEETSFNRTLDRGIQLFEQETEGISKLAAIDRDILSRMEANAVAGEEQYRQMLRTLQHPLETHAQAFAMWLDELNEVYHQQLKLLEQTLDELKQAHRLHETTCQPFMEYVANTARVFERNLERGSEQIESYGKVEDLDPQNAERNLAVLLDALRDIFQSDDPLATNGFKRALQYHLQQDYIIPGEVVFRLYDTYGFPVDMTRQMAEERGLQIDEKGFEQEMAAAKARSRATTTFKVNLSQDDSDWIPVVAVDEIEFLGYEETEADAHIVKYRFEGDQIQFVLDRTPFYAESGGQVGDTGRVYNSDFSIRVEDTQKIKGQIVHIGTLQHGEITDNLARAVIDKDRRAAIRRNHTATHLLHKALRDALGTHVQQKGSLVAPDRLRFDISHYEAIDEATLHKVESHINQKILQNIPVETHIKPLEEAQAMGAMALFGEKYDEMVRVVQIADYSLELCGGTHCRATGDIGLCKIVNESSISAGVRRIEAVTGEGALADMVEKEHILQTVAHTLKCAIPEVPLRVNDLQNKIKALQKENEELQQQAIRGKIANILDDVTEVNGVRVLATQLDGADGDALKSLCDELRPKLGRGIAVLGSVLGGKVVLVVMVTDDLVKTGVKAGDIIKPIAKIVGGGGGGRPNLAQAGGKNPEKLGEAIQQVPEIVETFLPQ